MPAHVVGLMVLQQCQGQSENGPTPTRGFGLVRLDRTVRLGYRLDLEGVGSMLLSKNLKNVFVLRTHNGEGARGCTACDWSELVRNLEVLIPILDWELTIEDVMERWRWQQLKTSHL